LNNFDECKGFIGTKSHILEDDSGMIRNGCYDVVESIMISNELFPNDCGIPLKILGGHMEYMINVFPKP